MLGICIGSRHRRRRYRRMLALRIVGPRFKNFGIIGIFTLVITLSVICVTTNILLSLFITSGSIASGSILSRWLGPSWDLSIHTRELDLLDIGDRAIVRIEGLPPGSDYEAIARNDSVISEIDSQSNLTSTVLSSGNTSSVLSGNTSGSTPQSVGPANGGHPWWWVEFRVQNETYLAEVDKFLFSSAEMHDFSLKVGLDDIDNLRVSLPPLIPGMRNPCWLEVLPDNFTFEDSLYKCHINYRRIRKSFAFLSAIIAQRGQEGLRWRVRCFPAFFLIGVAKCGTTDLYEAMTQHPDIITSELKEPEYWSRQRYGTNPWLFQTDCSAFKAQATFADYLDTYDNASEAVRRSFVRDTSGSWHSDVLFGDYSTHTMEELFFWDRSQEEPRYITANHIHTIRPQTKFIVIFRDPVERAYSRYKMRFKNRGNVAGTTDDFHERMERQVTGTEECLRTYKRRVCVYKENIGKAGDHTILVNGMYIIYLKDWLDVFPLEQFMIIRFEDYIMDRLGHIEKITQFLGLNAMPEPDKEYIRSMPAANAGISIGGGMRNETRTLLQDFFRPLNNELIELTGDDRFSWGY